MSDIHFAAEGNVLGHDPRIRLETAIEHINAHHSDAEMCVITGDMVNRGTQADYEGPVSYTHLTLPTILLV